MSSYPKSLLGKLVTITTGKLDANAADVGGRYPFFTCAVEPLAINDFAFDCNAVLVAGNGDLNVKHYHGKFNAYQRTYVITPLDEQELDTRYLYHFLESHLNTLRAQSIGGVIKYIKMGNLTEANLPFPHIQEQRRIAAILDKADSLRRKRQQAIQLADDFLRATYLAMAREAKKTVLVKDLLAHEPNAIRTGPFGSQLLVSEFKEAGIPVLGIDNVVTNTFKWVERRYIDQEKYEQLSRYTVRPGDVMVSIMGTTGRVAIAPDDLPLCISTKHLCTVTVDKEKATPEFLWASLRWCPDVRAQTTKAGKGAIMDGWNMGIVKALEIRLPDIEVQKRFSHLLANMNALRRKQNAASAKIDILSGSLTTEFFCHDH